MAIAEWPARLTGESSGLRGCLPVPLSRRLLVVSEPGSLLYMSLCLRSQLLFFALICVFTHKLVEGGTESFTCCFCAVTE